IPSQPLTMLAQHLELLPNGVDSHSREEIAGVGVLCHQTERLPLAGASDQDGRVRPLHRLRRVQRTLQLVELSLEGRLVTFPHPRGYAQRFLQALESLRHGRKLNPQPSMLLFFPSRSNAKVGAAVGQNVERRRRLDQYPRMPIRNSSHDRT